MWWKHIDYYSYILCTKKTFCAIQTINYVNKKMTSQLWWRISFYFSMHVWIYVLVERNVSMFSKTPTCGPLVGVHSCMLGVQESFRHFVSGGNISLCLDLFFWSYSGDAQDGSLMLDWYPVSWSWLVIYFWSHFCCFSLSNMITTFWLNRRATFEHKYYTKVNCICQKPSNWTHLTHHLTTLLFSLRAHASVQLANEPRKEDGADSFLSALFRSQCLVVSTKRQIKLPQHWRRLLCLEDYF